MCDAGSTWRCSPEGSTAHQGGWCMRRRPVAFLSVPLIVWPELQCKHRDSCLLCRRNGVLHVYLTTGVRHRKTAAGSLWLNPSDAESKTTIKTTMTIKMTTGIFYSSCCSCHLIISCQPATSSWQLTSVRCIQRELWPAFVQLLENQLNQLHGRK